MGETAELRNPQAGSFGFNDFINQGDGNATIRRMLRTLLPTVDMRDFQRRYKFDTGAQALTVGQRLTQVLWRVPAGEFWRPAGLFFTNADSAVHDIICITTIDAAALTTWQVSRTRVDASSSKLVFGSDQDSTMTSGVNTFWMSKVPIILEPADAFAFIDEDVIAAVGPVTHRWTFVYEIVPGPATPLTKGVVGAKVVT